MAKQPEIGDEIYDSLFSFEKGMNSGIAAALLPKNQLAFLTNGTVRGTLVNPRPRYRKMLLDFVGDGVQSASTQALFQGVGYYKPDSGLECLMSAVAGRLFQFQVDGPNAHVTEVTTPSLQQSASATQAWVWAAERWTIFNDGINLPLFYDGSTIRRSLGNTTSIVGVTTGFTTSGVGNANTATLIGPYTGPLPGNISIGLYKYQVTAVTPAVGTAFTLNGATAFNSFAGGTSLPSGTAIKKASAYYAFNLNAVPPFPTGGSSENATVHMSAPFFGDSSKKLSIDGNLFNILFIGTPGDPNAIIVNRVGLGPLPSGVPASKVVIISGSTVTFSTVSTTSEALVLPVAGAAFAVHTVSAYTGSAGDYLIVTYAGIGDFQFKVTSFSTDPTTSYTAQIVGLNTSAGGPPSGTVVGNPSNLVLSGLELPAGRMGVYAMFRNWMSLPDGISFIASDQVGDSSGTVTYQFRDAVLEVTQNAFLLGGGVFRIPSAGEQIQAIKQIPTLDTTLDGGPIAVLTPNIVFSCQSPVDRTTWQGLTNPILSVSMIDSGAEGQDSTQCANSDLLFRSPSGSRSLILARRDFATWGNVPISREIESTLSEDDKQLLTYGSAIVFDNRKLETANPIQSSLGVYHTKITALNFDPISSLSGKAPSVYDGIWQDLNVLKLVKGLFQGVERAFAFCLNSTLDTIELWEILPSADPSTQDSNGPVTMEFDCPVIFREPDLKQRRFKRLINGEIFVDKLVGIVNFQVFYRPDDYPSWIPWLAWSEEAKLDAPDASKPQFRPRMGLGEPSGMPCDSVTNRPFREGYYFQIKVIITGHCQFKGGRFMAISIPEPKFAPPSC